MSAAAQVFSCEKLHAKLSVATCRERSRVAHQRRTTGAKALEAAQVEQCRGCDLGRAHRAGKPTPPELLVSIEPKPTDWSTFKRDPIGAAKASPYRTKPCRECGQPFKPRGGRHATCDSCKERMAAAHA